MRGGPPPGGPLPPMGPGGRPPWPPTSAPVRPHPLDEPCEGAACLLNDGLLTSTKAINLSCASNVNLRIHAARDVARRLRARRSAAAGRPTRRPGRRSSARNVRHDQGRTTRSAGSPRTGNGRRPHGRASLRRKRASHGRGSSRRQQQQRRAREWQRTRQRRSHARQHQDFAVRGE